MNFDPNSAKPEAAFDPATDDAPSPRETLRLAVKVNPDQAAEAARLAKRYVAPNELILRNRPPR